MPIEKEFEKKLLCKAHFNAYNDIEYVINFDKIVKINSPYESHKGEVIDAPTIEIRKNQADGAHEDLVKMYVKKDIQEIISDRKNQNEMVKKLTEYRDYIWYDFPIEMVDQLEL